jgi:hypothetical protein
MSFTFAGALTPLELVSLPSSSSHVFMVVVWTLWSSYWTEILFYFISFRCRDGKADWLSHLVFLSVQQMFDMHGFTEAG